MRDGGRIAAAIAVMNDVVGQRTPLKDAVRDWGKRARYAGSGDRAWVSGLVLDALRRRNSVGRHMGSDAPRSLILGALKLAWNWPVTRIELALKDEHGPSALTREEREALLLAPDTTGPVHVRGDFPEWMTPHMLRAFGDAAAEEGAAMAVRASVDLRVNTLKSDAERAGRALETIGARPIPELVNGFRTPPPDAASRTENVEAIPAYSKGWVEVQDMGSQIAALASGVRPGDQVLDFCAGGGGKTLSMAALMENSGQVFAHDVDGKRLSALIPRLKRGGVRNTQLRHPKENASLDDLFASMDVVLIDAPCTGVGTWRRRPDSKWRVSEAALAKRSAEQAEILRTASAYVKPGGRLVYVTCSFLMEENEDQIAAFASEFPGFSAIDVSETLIRSGGLTPVGENLVRRLRRPDGSLRLTPLTAGSDGFFVAALRRAA
ncbi:MFS transporter [bacterium]|nr:MFS transporter [bacterium]